jgi:signal transduction histidine kinase
MPANPSATRTVILPPNEKSAAMGDSIGHLAHDFNNLLAAISGSASLLEMAGAAAQPDTARHVRNIQAATARGARIMQQLLSLSPRTDAPIEPIAVSELLREAQHAAGSLLGAAYVLSYFAPDNLPSLPCDRRQVLSVLAVLAENARDAMPQGGTLVLTARSILITPDEAKLAGATAGEAIAFTAQDHGPGITPELMARLGEPFFTTKPKGKGAGLGLAIANRIARRHGGFVRVETEPNAGTRVTICLPIGTAAGA